MTLTKPPGLGARPGRTVSAESLEEQRIRSGVLRHVREAVIRNRTLPGEVELATRLDCSRPQIRLALAELERQGIVHRRQGAATTVDPVALRMNVRLEEQQEHTELLTRLGYAASVEVCHSELAELPAALTPLLTPDADSRAFRVQKRWFADGRPAMIATDTMALPTGGPPIDWTAPGIEGESVFTLAERIWGEAIVWEVATPGVTTVDGSTAALMELPVGTAVMTLELIGVAVSGRRLFHAFEHHNPDIVSYSFVRTIRPPWATGFGA